MLVLGDFKKNCWDSECDPLPNQDSPSKSTLGNKQQKLGGNFRGTPDREYIYLLKK